MATNRSLNKLEFKAHMSIHNKVAVPDEEAHASSYTRDRFQKKHLISNDDGSSRLPDRRAAVRRAKKSMLVLAIFAAAHIFLQAQTTMAAPGRNTDIRVESSELGETDLDARLNSHMGYSKDEKFGIFMNDSTALDFNEDGDPNLRMRY